MQNYINVVGAKTHNLQNINVKIPKNKLIVITGLSGSGKSSLAFDTIYAEGQRRYVDSLSPYIRQFLNISNAPDVKYIDGLSPAIAIDQKTAPRNPRSTVGTTTEIYDYMRLLYAKIGIPHCPICYTPIQKQTIGQIVNFIDENIPKNHKLMILAPLVIGQKGEHIHTLEKIKKGGFIRLRIDGEIFTIADDIRLDKNKQHTIEVVIDRIISKDFGIKKEKLKTGEMIHINNQDRTRLLDSIELASKQSEGTIIIYDVNDEQNYTFSEKYSCPNHPNVSLPELEPRTFSFNSPFGACEACHGLGVNLEFSPDLIIKNPNLSISEGVLTPWANSSNQLGWFVNILQFIAKKYKFSLNTPWNKLDSKIQNLILNGTGDETYNIDLNGVSFSGKYTTKYEGVIPYLKRRYKESDKPYVLDKLEKFMRIKKCHACNGMRLKAIALQVKINDKNIMDICNMSVKNIIKFFKNIKLNQEEIKIAESILKEINDRLLFLENVGLSYLTLNRSANTLSGGEAQRIRLATQIGSKLSGILYVLDEPSIGLHQKDNYSLIKTLKMLRDLDNTVIVVEHDEDTIKEADFIIDMGPGAGKHGGKVIATGNPKEIMQNKNSLTGKYLSGEFKIDIPIQKRIPNNKYIKIYNASENNLKNIDVKLPLGLFVVVSGVSGSGKSSLINETLVNHCMSKFYDSKVQLGKCDRIEGLEYLDKIININQTAIGRTPRSNPATYTTIFTEIRSLMAKTPEARLRGYNAGRFSFNIKGGRCEACKGDGVKKIEMQFLPDVYVTCETCKGKRYNDETLEITYRGKNISQILDMTVEEAYEFFNAIPVLKRKLKTLQDVGLSYVQLGQSSTTLSGGEAQRVKLASELAKKSTGKTLYVLDEPTTGLHAHDVAQLIGVLQKLVQKKNTVVIIEHNLDVIQSADYIIDLGPEGGDKGGYIVAEGTPKQIAENKKSYTGQWLKKICKK